MPTSARQVPFARQSAGPKESWRELGACSGGHIGRPYDVRRGCGGNRGPVRAAIQAAPTDAPPIRFVGRGAHTPPNQAAGIAGLASIAAAAGPLVGAGFMPARAAPPGATGPRSSRPGHGGMWACRPTRFRGGVRWETQSCPGGYKIRPYGLRRGCGGNRGLVRAAIQAAPTDAPPIRFVGRGAHTPPNQAAGIAGLASIAAAAGPLVGAGFMPARAAPPGATGPRSSRPGHGGMWACRPTRFRGGVRWETQSCPGGYKIRPYGVRRGCGGDRQGQKSSFRIYFAVFLW